MLCARGFRLQLVPLSLGKAGILQVRTVSVAQLDVFIRLVVRLSRSRTQLKAPRNCPCDSRYERHKVYLSKLSDRQQAYFGRHAQQLFRISNVTVRTQRPSHVYL